MTRKTKINRTPRAPRGRFYVVERAGENPTVVYLRPSLATDAVLAGALRRGPFRTKAGATYAAQNFGLVSSWTIARIEDAARFPVTTTDPVPAGCGD